MTENARPNFIDLAVGRQAAQTRLSGKTKTFLQEQIPLWYNTERFPVEADPLGVVRTYLPSRDRRCVEVAAFFAALFAWGRRDIAIAKTEELLLHLIAMPGAIVDAELRGSFADLQGFKHRTFTQPVVRALVLRMQDLFDRFGTLEQAFVHFVQTSPGGEASEPHHRVERALNGFRRWFFEVPWAQPCERHIASPERGSACKRLNLMLRWLVRPNDHGLDLGLWKQFCPAELVMPLDVHVVNSARQLKLMPRATLNWKAATELTAVCRRVVPADPVVLDYALFGLSQGGYWGQPADKR